VIIVSINVAVAFMKTCCQRPTIIRKLDLSNIIKKVYQIALAFGNSSVSLWMIVFVGMR